MIYETKTTLSVDIVRMEFNLDGLPNSAVHVSGFCNEDGSIVEFHAMSLASTVLSYSQLVQMFQSNVPLMFL
jgi:hypothetical protein